MVDMKDTRQSLMIDPSTMIRLVIESNQETNGLELYFECSQCSRDYMSDTAQSVYACRNCNYEVTRPEIDRYLLKVSNLFQKMTKPVKVEKDEKKSIWRLLMSWIKRL